MTGYVIARTFPEGAGSLGVDAPATFEQAEQLAGRRLDRRRAYAIIDGKACELAQWSQPCSGCHEGALMVNPGARGQGCDECGYTGRRRVGQWLPLMPF